MSKNILILTGSPRKGGNTDKLADAFIAGAQQAGHTTLKYATAKKNIKGCIDCLTCFKKGTACSVPDDFSELAPLLEQAEMVVFATPMYWYTFPVHIKAAIEKLYAYVVAKKPLKIKESALLVCGGGNDNLQEVISGLDGLEVNRPAGYTENKFEGIIKSYQLIAHFMNWKDSGVITVSGLHDKDDILKTDGLKRAERLGRNLL